MNEIIRGPEQSGKDEFREYLEVLDSIAANDRVAIRTFDPLDIADNDISSSSELPRGSLFVTVTGPDNIRENVEAWAIAIDLDIANYGGQGRGKWEKTTTGLLIRRVFSMNKMFVF